MTRPIPIQWIAAAAGLTCLTLLSGCGDDEIQAYTVPHVAKVAPSTDAPTAAPQPVAPMRPMTTQATSGPQRMLGAMAPHGDGVWFFKLSGPPEAIGQVAGAFETFIKSLKFGEGGQVTWTTPAGWSEEPASGMRIATFHVDAGGSHLDLAVTKFPAIAEMQSVLANVNRWRGQMGLTPVTEAQLGDVTKTIDAGGVTVTMVDYTKEGGAAASGAATPGGPTLPAGHPPVDGAAPGVTPGSALGGLPGPAAGGSSGITFAQPLPEGWRETTAPGGVSLHTFDAGGAGAMMSITLLPGDAGGMHANINRWRQQVGLAPVDASKIGEVAKLASVDGLEGASVDLAGESKRIVGVILPTPTSTWFIKMTGPNEAVEAQVAAFQQFVRSVHFAGGEK
ncbi:MAG: hypothetical protein GC159_00715 [Phycisphaera sp.]|nr:hypothetical protein [Phycisphaera sp.]